MREKVKEVLLVIGFAATFMLYATMFLRGCADMSNQEYFEMEENK